MLRFAIVRNKTIATASFIIPSPNKTAFSTGNLSGFNHIINTLIRDIAATVSVAHKTLLNNIIYLRVNYLKIKPLMREQNKQRQIKPIIVPMTPRNVIIPKF
jgi:hypothetical protein